MVFKRWAVGLVVMALAGMGSGTPSPSRVQKGETPPSSAASRPDAPAQPADEVAGDVVRPAAPELRIADAAKIAAAAVVGTSRAVLVFASSPADPSFLSQIDMIDRDPGQLVSRDVVVITDTDPAGQSEWRRKLRPVGFSLVILDRQGVVVDRKPFPWSSREIGRAIDKTPESRAENARNRSGAGFAADGD